MSKVFFVFYTLAIAVTLVVALSPHIYEFFSKTADQCASFTFKWVGQNFMVPDGVLWLNVTFDWSTDELEATIRVNDDDFNATDFVLLAFGKNGSPPKPYQRGVYALFVNNLTVPRSITYFDEWGYGGSFSYSPLPIASPYHTCHYEDSGYTFHFQIPNSSVEFPLKVHLSWCDTVPYQPGMTSSDILVFVQFSV